MIGAARYVLVLDSNIQGKISIFYMARMLLISLVLLSTIFLKQEVLGSMAIAQMYAALTASFFFSVINTSFWEQTLKVRRFMPSQLLYDLLLTSYLVYLTGVNDSIFLFLYLLNIVFASLVYQLNGALLVSSISGLTFAFIYYANNDMDQVNAWYNLAWHELLFLLTALLCGQFMDELKKQKQLLETQRANIERLELLNDRLLNSIPVGIVLVDESEYVQKINLTALASLKLSHPPAMRLKYYELLPELKGIFSAWDQMTETQRLRYLFRATTDQPPSLSVQIVKLSHPDNKSRHIIVFQDISQTLQLEQRLEFESKLAATGELAAGIAHEIRNPLASISGSIELLSKNLQIESEQDKKLLAISLREIRRLNHLITDFLEYAKPKDNSSNDFLVSELITEVAEAVQSRSSTNNVVILNKVPASTSGHANRERMKQVFFNLFLNSIEAVNNTTPEISVEMSAIEDGLLVLDVRDNGPGVPAAISEKIFDPFFTTKSDGTGLGLATVAQILRGAKGAISLEPSTSGAHFRILLPASSTMEMASTAS